MTQCAKVRTFPLQGEVQACLPNGTPLTIDDGPVDFGYVPGADLWWHLTGSHTSCFSLAEAANCGRLKIACSRISVGL